MNKAFDEARQELLMILDNETIIPAAAFQEKLTAFATSFAEATAQQQAEAGPDVARITKAARQLEGVSVPSLRLRAPGSQQMG